MNPLLGALGRYALEHLASIGVGAGIVAVSAIHNMPPQPPHSLRWIDADLWTWTRDTLQTAIPIRQVNPSHPTPPASPAESSKQ